MMGEDARVLGGRLQRSGYNGQRLVRESSRERGMGGMALFVSVGWILAAAVAFGLSRRVAAWAVGRSWGQPHGNGRQTREREEKAESAMLDCASILVPLSGHVVYVDLGQEAGLKACRQETQKGFKPG